MRSRLGQVVFHYLLLFSIKFGENQQHGGVGKRCSFLGQLSYLLLTLDTGQSNLLRIIYLLRISAAPVTNESSFIQQKIVKSVWQKLKPIFSGWMSQLRAFSPDVTQEGPGRRYNLDQFFWALNTNVIVSSGFCIFCSINLIDKYHSISFICWI